VWHLVRRWGPRAVGLVVTAIGIYVVAPSVVALLGEWPSLRDVRPLWFGVLVVLVVGGWSCLWVLVRTLLPETPWTTVGSAQLAGLATGCVLPGGAATGTVVQASMLVRAGHQPGKVGAALGSVGLLTTGMLLALPILTVPAVIIRPPPARQLQLGLVVSLVVAVVLVLVGLALLHWDSFVGAIGRTAGRVIHLVRRQVSAETVADRVVAQRDAVAAAFAGHWGRALSAAAGNRMLDYSALVAAVYAVGGRARPSMVLLAYVLSLALALVPITPGGLGFVEAGLTSILVLAGVSSDQAVLGTLLYRLFAFWLPIPLGVLAWTGWRFTAGQRSGA
jgi:putative heme transporter